MIWRERILADTLNLKEALFIMANRKTFGYDRSALETVLSSEIVETLQEISTEINEEDLKKYFPEVIDYFGDKVKIKSFEHFKRCILRLRDRVKGEHLFTIHEVLDNMSLNLNSLYPLICFFSIGEYTSDSKFTIQAKLVLEKALENANLPKEEKDKFIEYFKQYL